jgi:hypothetical protein
VSYAAHFPGSGACFGEKGCGSGTGAVSKPGLLRRILNAIFESHQKQTDRDVARFFIRSGGRLTDELEREMTQRLFKGNWDPRQ